MAKSLVSCFFDSRCTSETNYLLCLAEFARLPLDGSSYHEFNWCRNQEAVVHGQF